MKLKYLLALPLVAALTACSSDEPAPVPDGVEVPFYTTMSITLPSTGTRAENPVEGEEVGQDIENKVNSIQVVLTKRTGTEGNYKYEKVIASKSGSIVKGSTYTVLFDAKELVSGVAELEDNGMDVYAFVICNDLNYDVDNFDIDKTFTGGANVSFSTTQEAIRMTSAPYKAHLPKKSELLKHDTETKAYDLTAQVNGAIGGPIKVERAVARFDFKSKVEGDNVNMFNIENGGVVRGHVQITDMALINENNEVYYFGRTNNNGLTTTTPLTHQLVASLTNVGLITPTSLQYVVCPNALETRTFNNPLSTLDLNRLSWTSIATLTQDDNHTGTWDNSTEPEKAGYKIWRYCNENAIPASDANSTVNNNQKNGVSTGIVFKGKILNGTDDMVIPGYGAEELYLFRQTMYGDFTALYKAAYSTGVKANPDLQAAFEKTWELSETGTYTVTDGETVKKYALKVGQTRGGNGFTVYKNIGSKDAPVYPVYYYYWNRHDDNGQSNVMGAMEFSVVRNNVYKLSINSVSMFGCSGTDDDPDKPKPDDPDEKEHMYIKIDVQVMPWTVRLNGIDL